MENKKYVAVSSIIIVALAFLSIFLYLKQKDNKETEEVVNEESAVSNQEESFVEKKIDKEKILKYKFNTIADGRVNVSGNIEEVKDGEVILDIFSEYVEKELRTLKISESTNIYRMKSVDGAVEETVIAIGDLKTGDFVNVLIEAEDNIETKNIFNALDIYVSEIVITEL